MVVIKIRLNVLVAFIVLIFAVILAYFLISIELSSVSTTTLPKTTTVLTTTKPPTTTTSTTTLPASLKKRLLELANENIKDRCNVTYTYVEKKHFPTSKWFSDLCPNFKDYNETEKWRTSAFLNDECDLEKENGCIEIFTSISLDEKLICVWAIDHPLGKMITFETLTQEYC
jgi:hypothetical protein